MLQDVMFTSVEKLVTSLSTILVVVPLIRVAWKLLVEELRPAKRLKIRFNTAEGKQVEMNTGALNSRDIRVLLETIKTGDDADTTASKKDTRGRGFRTVRRKL